MGLDMHKRFIILLVVFCAMFNGEFGQRAFALNVMYATDPAKNISPQNSAMIVSRDENRTVITILPRYAYDGEHFGMLIPLPKFVSETQVKVGGFSAAQNILSYTSPRVSYYKDVNLCGVKDGAPTTLLQEKNGAFKALGVNNDILPQSIKPAVEIIHSEALKNKSLVEHLKERNLYLNKNYLPIIEGYKAVGTEYVLITTPKGEEGHRSLPAVQLAYESDSFSIPIGLSGHSSDVAQDLTIVFISRDGLISPKTLPLKKMVHDKALPLFVAKSFDADYEAIFKKSLLDDNFQSIFLEYAGDVKWCPTCTAAQKLSVADLRGLGAWWLDSLGATPANERNVASRSDVDNVYLTRLHLRHTEKTIISSVEFTQSKDKNRFVTTYNVHEPFLSAPKCEVSRLYKSRLAKQYQSEVDNYVALTAHQPKDVKDRMEQGGQSFDIPTHENERHWWEHMWSTGAVK
jgi:hypothetical protein|tara:strand:- start:155901 stop:157280 length:1380 start_codon:yes stop_codon:yes gene_type:complete